VKWQYITLDVAIEDDMSSPHQLNAAGDNGWELIAVIPKGDVYRAFLKRPIADDDPIAEAERRDRLFDR